MLKRVDRADGDRDSETEDGELKGGGGATSRQKNIGSGCSWLINICTYPFPKPELVVGLENPKMNLVLYSPKRGLGIEIGSYFPHIDTVF